MSTPTTAGPAAATTLLPNLLIVGVKKAGTTSLFGYLGQHPDVFAPDVKAVNHFLPLRQGAGPEDLPPLERYAAHFAAADEQRYRLEAPSSYLYGGARIAGPLVAALPDVRAIVSLRDPVRRLWSDFSMKRRERTLPAGVLTFDAYVRDAYDAYRTGTFEELPGLTGFARGVYADALEPWLQLLGDRLRVVFLERWSPAPADAVRDLYGWLDLDPTPAAALGTVATNPNRDYRSRAAAEVARRAYRTLRDRLPALEAAKPALLRIHDGANGRANGERLTDDAQRRLAALYAPANRRLAALLRDHGYHDLPTWLTDLEG